MNNENNNQLEEFETKKSFGGLSIELQPETQFRKLSVHLDGKTAFNNTNELIEFIDVLDDLAMFLNIEERDNFEEVDDDMYNTYDEIYQLDNDHVSNMIYKGDY